MCTRCTKWLKHQILSVPLCIVQKMMFANTKINCLGKTACLTKVAVVFMRAESYLKVNPQFPTI